MTDGAHDSKILNDLLASVVDSIDGFGKANELVDTASFKPIFAEVVAERREIAGEIETRIRQLGGSPDEEGTLLASAHRVLMKLRDFISGSDVAVVDEAERGENLIQGKFEKAMSDTTLSPETSAFVASMAARVREGHQLIRDLKHSLHSANT